MHCICLFNLWSVIKYGEESHIHLSVNFRSLFLWFIIYYIEVEWTQEYFQRENKDFHQLFQGRITIFMYTLWVSYFIGGSVLKEVHIFIFWKD